MVILILLNKDDSILLVIIGFNYLFVLYHKLGCFAFKVQQNRMNLEATHEQNKIWICQVDSDAWN